ncbi:LSU ribosomal protein L24P [Natranaerovirga pectinivora]|uniref:Large ribosomal subunit protein uL24 n=1 Tax=Natranaerovirga pectinivora TaxID=682400 RepID=A0A4R3MIS8_9FIRM|nr:50S ribosomal protein L24 [Natranaerovirga pectinivora]TCT14077.1 LSU ribosomal protein L24P [Natranaerovirga pectinivora]
MAKMKIKSGDTVRIIAGKDKGKEGKIIKVDKKSERVFVEGANMITKHAKPSAANQQGGIIQQEGAIHASNVMYVHKNKPVRLGVKEVEGKNGQVKRVRFAKSTGEVID